MISDFINGIATGSATVNTGSEAADFGTDLIAQVLGFFGGIVENFGS
ncbi:MAG: hypothetical protein ACK4UY_07275 [Dietzia sp.]